MKTILLATVAAAAAIAPAQAQEHPFSGPRLGAEVAYEDFGSGTDGATLAAVAGWDFDLGKGWVAGVQGRIAILGVSQSETAALPGGQVQQSDVSIEENWGLSARLGHVVGRNVLLFAEGGYERMHVDAVRTVNRQPCTPPTGCLVSRSDFSFNEDLWTVGAGAEWAVTPNLRLTGRYVYAEGDAFDRNRLSVGVAWQF